MKRRIIAALAAATVVVSVSLASLPAHADSSPIPDRVTEWFRDTAPGIIATLSADSPEVRVDSNGLKAYPYGSTVGAPVAVWTWGDGFLRASRPTADMLVARGDWYAPILSAGRPVGVLNACVSAQGSIEWGADPDQEKAAALVAARATDYVADDGLNGLFIVSSDKASQYGLSRLGIRPVAGSLKQLQGAVLEQQQELNAANEAAGEVLTGAMPFAFDQYIQRHPESSTANLWRTLVPTVAVLLMVSLVIGLVVRRHPKILS